MNAEHVVTAALNAYGDKTVGADGYIVKQCSCGVVATHQRMLDHLVRTARQTPRGFLEGPLND